MPRWVWMADTGVFGARSQAVLLSLAVRPPLTACPRAYLFFLSSLLPARCVRPMALATAACPAAGGGAGPPAGPGVDCDGVSDVHRFQRGGAHSSAGCQVSGQQQAPCAAWALPGRRPIYRPCLPLHRLYCRCTACRKRRLEEPVTKHLYCLSADPIAPPVLPLYCLQEAQA
jgi:hypothetical protein